ncbi:30S ribosomal protein S9 [Anaerohalosphaeraceae bacterium U12dextr]
MTENQNISPLIDPNILVGKTASSPAVPAAPKSGFWWGVGRRKTSVARVRIKPGKGEMSINNRQLEEYFKLEKDRNSVKAPLKSINGLTDFDVYVNVDGGGVTGQAGAVMQGIARALKNYNPAFLKELRDGGFLTRDSRAVERKKYGRAGARRRFQFSKR